MKRALGARVVAASLVAGGSVLMGLATFGTAMSAGGDFKLAATQSNAAQPAAATSSTTTSSTSSATAASPSCSPATSATSATSSSTTTTPSGTSTSSCNTFDPGITTPSTGADGEFGAGIGLVVAGLGAAAGIGLLQRRRRES